MTTKQKLEALIDASLEGNLPASFTEADRAFVAMEMNSLAAISMRPYPEAMDRRIRELYAVLVADDWELGE
jgi:hypothetical protein